MAEPWNKWYPHDIDTWQGSGNIQALSDTGYRAVHNIMQDMWKQDDCSLPCDQKVLRKASRVADRWESCKEEVMDYFDRTEEGSLTSNVLLGKWTKAKEVYESRQSAAKSTNSRRSPHGHRTVTAPIASRSADTVTDTGTSTKAKTTTTAVAVVDLPGWIDREIWNAYLEMRKKKRAYPTERAIKGILSQLGNFRNKGHDPNAILDTSIRSNWTDVYEPKTGAVHGNQSKGDATYDALRRSIQAGRNQGTAGETGDTPASEDGGVGVRGLLGRSDAIRDDGYQSGPGVTILPPSR